MPYSRTASVVGVDPYARPTTTASDRGYFCETYPASISTGTSAMPNTGRLEFIKIRLPNSVSVTNIVMHCGTGGSVLTAGQCFAVLYTAAGARVGVTADQAASWASTGLKTMALVSGPFACAAADYYVAMWFVGTTGPAWMRTGVGSSLGQNAGFVSPNLVIGSADTGLTTTSPTNMGAQTATNTTWWVALS